MVSSHILLEMAELEKNHSFYDGVLLDAKILKYEDDQPGSEDTEYIYRAKDDLLQFTKKKFEIFVFTGQAEAYDSRDFKKAFPRVYRKGNTDERTRLFNDLIIAAESQDDIQLKHQFRNIFQLCDNKYIGSNQFERVFFLIKDLENKDSIEKTGDLFNPIRKIIEALFGGLRDIGIIPSEVITLNRSSLFLSNKHNDYTHLSEFIHPMVAENLYRLINITQDGSHGEGELRLRVDEYLQHNNSDFLYKSTIYLLFDILMWFKQFIDNHSDVEENRVLWENKATETSDWILGCVIRIDENNWGKFQPINTTDEITIHWKMVVDKELEKDDYIKVITEPSPDGSKLHIKAITKDV